MRTYFNLCSFQERPLPTNGSPSPRSPLARYIRMYVSRSMRPGWRKPIPQRAPLCPAAERARERAVWRSRGCAGVLAWCFSSGRRKVHVRPIRNLYEQFYVDVTLTAVAAPTHGDRSTVNSSIQEPPPRWMLGFPRRHQRRADCRAVYYQLIATHA